MLLLLSMKGFATAHRRSVLRRRNRRHGRLSRAPHASRRPSAERIARAAVNRRASTLLDLVQTIQQQVSSDTEVVTIVTWLINSGAVVLTGSFAGQRI
jgi:hypothetical protein